MSAENACEMKKIYLYTRFERFWHWMQAALILGLLITGLEIHGSYTWLGFKTAVEVHNFCAWTWIVLYAFVLFWMATTGEWKQYIPTTKRLFDVAFYYAFGIFKGESHPVPKSERTKHNPLQRLTYLGISVLILPLQMATGLLYYFYNDWAAWGIADFLSLEVLAFIHMAGAFALFTF
ncbi:MAG: cytochrome b/b6 domain-containing protein, partial [Desulfarculaceae bacterium]